MFTLQGAVKHYDWGSTDQIPGILGIPASPTPLAEYWLGAHSGGPASLADTTLDRVIAADPSLAGANAVAEFDGRLPYMVKLLSAAQPLSLQAHPNRAQAMEGFAGEESTDVPIDANQRTFKDPWDKPEVLVALTPFDALVGFRSPALTLDLFDALGVLPKLEPVLMPLMHRDARTGLAQVFLDFLILDESHTDLLTSVVVAAVNHVNDVGAVGDFARTTVMLDQFYPGDTSLLAALLMNHYTLAPTEAIHVAPGTMHSYLHGMGVEVMGNSDNVLRGGLTNKYIDPSALVSVVDFTPDLNPLLVPQEISAGLWHYDAGERAFTVWRLEPAGLHDIHAPGERSGRILLVTEGRLTLTTPEQHLDLHQGEAGFLAAGEQVTVSGHGQAFLSATGLDG